MCLTSYSGFTEVLQVGIGGVDEWLSGCLSVDLFSSEPNQGSSPNARVLRFAETSGGPEC